MWWSMLAVELSVRDFDSHNTFCASDLVCVCTRVSVCLVVCVLFSVHPIRSFGNECHAACVLVAL
jgi:hypothetical protein